MVSAVVSVCERPHQSFFSRLLLLLTLPKGEFSRQDVESVLHPWQMSVDEDEHLTGYTIFIEDFAILLFEGATSSLFEAIERLALLRGSDLQKQALPRIRILYFTELHGYRLLPYLITAQIPGIPAAKADTDSENETEITEELILEHVFKIYQGLTLVSHRLATDNFRMPEGADAYLQSDENRQLLPSIDSLYLLDTSSVAEGLTWTESEFQNFFRGKFDIRLHSEPLV
ncbi:hypothetical protein TGPRC2_251857 [Toxoplasma gondii TgCatPRC2]|uniref:Uncharacterized protein n=2 Tax=Toxoplasma gondii TaxID=5811 RepID=A0A151H0Y8_TOXGO|nr:hypothetical protein TGVAND_251857 [Toxoplasma gondii VAND]KYK62995.1 hypothetical protein TGPRC2_251857 [Toxoplasma gondii TgCatPRC2]